MAERNTGKGPISNKRHPVGVFIDLREFPAHFPGQPLARPDQFWNAAIGRLVSGPTSVSGIFASPADQYEKIQIGLSQVAERDQAMAGAFIEKGYQTVLRHLDTDNVAGSPQKIQALREVAHTLQGLPGGLSGFGWRIPSLRPAREYLYGAALRDPSQILHETFANLGNQRYGVGQAANISEVVIARYNEFIDFVNRVGHLEMRHSIYELLEGMLDQYLAAGANPSYLFEVQGCFEKGLRTMSSGYRTTEINKFLQGKRAAHSYRSKLAQHAVNPMHGRGEAADLMSVFDYTDAALVKELSEKEPEAQVKFLLAATDALTQDVTTTYADRPHLLARAMNDHLALLTTSPIARKLEMLEDTPGGVKATRTLTPAIAYFVAKIFGTPMNDNGICNLSARRNIHPNKALFKQVADWVGSSSEKEPETARIAHTILAGNRLTLLQKPTPENMRKLRDSFIGAIENLTRNLLRTGEDGTIPLQQMYDYLHIIQLISPRTYAELAVELGAGPRLDKTLRYHSHRVALGEAASADTRDSFHAAYEASGKMFRNRLPPAPPANRALQAALDAGISQTIMIKHIGDNDKFGPFGDGLTHDGQPDLSFKGPTYLTSDGAGRITDEQEVKEWQRASSERLGQLFGQILGPSGRLNNPSFIKGKPESFQENFAAAELYIAGMLLREMAGEEGGEATKTAFREQYIPLLINIITDAAQPPDKQQYSAKMHDMVRHVAHDLLPFFPLASQVEFVESLMQNTIWNDPVLLDNSGIIDVLMPLGWNKDLGFPTVPNEIRDGDNKGRRPIADTIVTKSIDLVADFPYVKGRKDRRYLILECLGITLQDLKTLTPPALREKIQDAWDKQGNVLRQGIVYQLASLLGPFGSKGDHLKLALAVEDLILEDMLKLAPLVEEMPLEVTAFVEGARKVTQNTLKALNDAVGQITDTVIKISTATKLDLGQVSDFGDVPDHLKPLIDKVVTAAEAKMEELATNSGLKEVEKQTDGVAISLPTDTNDDSALTALIRAVAENRIEIPVDKMIEALQQLGKGTVSAEGISVPGALSPTGTILVAGERTHLDIAGTLMNYTNRTNAANALPAIAEKILEYNQANRHEALAISRESGNMTTVQQAELVRQLMLRTVAQVLSNNVTRQKFIMGLNASIERAEAQAATEARMIEVTLTNLGVEAAEQFTDERIREIRTVLRLRKQVQNQRRQAAQLGLVQLTNRINELAALAIESTAIGIDKTLQHARAEIEYLKRISEEGGSFAVLARAAVATIGSTDMPVNIVLPTPERLFQDVKEKYKQIEAGKTPPAIQIPATTATPVAIEPNGDMVVDNGHTTESVISN